MLFVVFYHQYLEENLNADKFRIWQDLKVNHVSP
jgi:hypothetical protein